MALPAPPCAATTTFDQLSSKDLMPKAERPKKLANCGLPYKIASQEVSKPRKADGAEEIVGAFMQIGVARELGQRVWARG